MNGRLTASNEEGSAHLLAKKFPESVKKFGSSPMLNPIPDYKHYR
jgi:hypothetical protein